MTEKEHDQRLSCIVQAVQVKRQDTAATAKDIVEMATEFYKFVEGKDETKD